MVSPFPRPLSGSSDKGMGVQTGVSFLAYDDIGCGQSCCYPLIASPSPGLLLFTAPIKELVVEASSDTSNLSFNEISDQGEFFEWLKEAFFPLLFDQRYYNGGLRETAHVNTFGLHTKVGSPCTPRGCRHGLTSRCR